MLGVRARECLERDVIEGLRTTAARCRRRHQRRREHVVQRPQPLQRVGTLALQDAPQEVDVERDVERLVPGQDGEHLTDRRTRLRGAEREAVRGRTDGLEHEVREDDRLVLLGPRVELVEGRGGRPHRPDRTSEVRQELGDELPVPAFLVAVEAEGLGELGVPGTDIVRDLVRLAKPGLLGGERRIEEADGGVLLLGAVPLDRHREIELLVVHARAALLEEAKPERGRAMRLMHDPRTVRSGACGGHGF